MGFAQVDAVPFASCSALSSWTQRAIAMSRADKVTRLIPGIDVEPMFTVAGGTVTAVAPALTQEAGVAEPNRIVSDGRSLFAIAGDALYIADVHGLDGDLLAKLDLPGPTEGVFLDGTSLVAIGTSATAPWKGGASWASVIDVSDPAHPTVVRALNLTGEFRDARLSDGRLVVVTADRIASGRSFGVSADQVADDPGPWMPHRSERKPDGSVIVQVAVGCGDVFATRSDGTTLTTVHTLDVRIADAPVRSIALTASPDVVYVTDSSVWIGQTRDLDPSQVDAGHTLLHRVDLTDHGPVPDGSIDVAGAVPGRFALSEQHGVLRVADSEGTGVAIGAWDVHRGDKIGGIDRIAPGERLTAVRFVGDRAYVGTVRAVDPLFVVDVARPAAMKVLGQLEVTGWSDLLVPLPDGRILAAGVVPVYGGNAPAVALFDATDPTAPRLLDREPIGGLDSAARSDLRVWTWDPATSTLALPAGRELAVIGVGDTLDLRDPLVATGIGKIGDAVIVGDVAWAVGERGVVGAEVSDPSGRRRTLGFDELAAR